MVAHMPGVKKAVVKIDSLNERIKELASEGYYKIAVCLKGSREHREAAIQDDYALLKAWRRKT
jgi:hypothetical protein